MSIFFLTSPPHPNISVISLLREEELPHGRTLFLANVPAQIGVDVHMYLKEAFAKFGEVELVRVKESSDNDAMSSYTVKSAIAFVIFRSSKGVKSVMNAPFGESRLPPPSVKASLAEYKPSKRQRKLHSQYQDTANETERKEAMAAALEEDVQSLVRRFRAKLPQAKLLQEEVDDYMARFEAAEEEAERKRKEAASKPDADGFVTVAYGKKRRRGGDADGSDGMNGGRKRGRAGSQKKKKKERELKNFYAHQMREAKREQLARLRTRFEEDKARIEKMKAARKFKPFG